MNWNHLAGSQGGYEGLEIDGAGMSRGVNTVFRNAVPFQPVLYWIIGTLFPIAFPLGINVDSPFQALSSFKIEPVQRPEKQG